MKQNRCVTVAAFTVYWLETVMKTSIRPSTYTAYKGQINNHINKHIGQRLLSGLDSSDIQQFVNRLCGSDKPLSSKSVHLIMTLFKNILSYAAELGYINKNPCRKISMPKLVEKETKAFSREEQHAIEETIERSSDNRDAGILICLYTGMRLGEVCALKWEDVNLKEKYLRMKNSLKRVYYSNPENHSHKTFCIEEEPKTKKSRRIIPLPDFLCRKMQELKCDSDDRYVISMRNGGYVKPRTMQLVYERLLKKADVEYSSFHTLRHTFASRAIELLADIKTVSEILGHTNSMITVNRYAHSLIEEKRKLMASMNNLYDKQ